MEAKVIVTTEIQLKAIIADAIIAAFKYYQPALAPISNITDENPVSTDEAAKRFGIAKQTLYQNVKKIKHTKRFGRLYFYPSDLRAYLNGGKGGLLV